MFSFPVSEFSFNPRQVGNLVLWLDGNDPNGTGTQPTNNAAVTTWTDKSGVGNNGTQSTAGKKPTFLTGQINNLGAISFASASSQTLQTTLTNFPLGSTGRTAFAVINSSGITAQQYPLTFGDTGADQQFTIGLFQSNLICDAHNNYCHGNTTLSSSTNYLLEVSYPAGGTLSQITFTVNGILNTTTVVGNNDVLSTVLTNSYIGSMVDNAAYFNGLIAEVLLYNSQLSTAQQSVVRQYLREKWGI